MGAEIGPIDRELDRLATTAGGRVLEAALEQFGVPLDLNRVVEAAVITGMDMGMALALEFREEAAVVVDHVGRAVGLTDADRAQRSLTFQALVETVRRES